MFAHAHQVSMVHAVRFVTFAFPAHGNQIQRMKTKMHLSVRSI